MKGKKLKCPKCQFENPEGVNFCVECGGKLEKICSDCGLSNSISNNFCGNCGHKLSLPGEAPPKIVSFDEKLIKIQRYLPKGLTEKILSQRDRIEGERKHVTVMFCDMEGFTQLVERLGPEESYLIMDEVYEILIHKVHDYEGTVNEMTGDGIMALFGAPVALEDAPQRAIRSAMAIHREITRFRDKMRQEKKDAPPLNMRAGIHTGPVVVGALGNDLRVEFKAVGETVNLASRMEGLAEPGTTYVTEDTFKLTEGFFRFESLGEKEVKGKDKPVSVFRVLAPSTRRTRFDVSAERGLTPFMARDRELELLLDSFERIKGGRGRAFSIVAEAGVGKSRLLYEFRKAVANEDITFLEGKCLSYNRGMVYHPVIDILKANFNIREGDRGSEIREKVNRGLKLLGADEELTLPYLLELLSVQDSGVDKLPISPEEKRFRIIESLKRIVIKGSEIRPLIMAFEDLHWVDESSEQVLKHVLESIQGARIFLIFTFRPVYAHGWISKSYHSQLTLNRLSERETCMMASHLLGAKSLDKDLEELILEKTEGVPFFIEEFIMSFKDLKVIERKDDQYCLVKDIRHIAVPSTIQDVIMARVDSLPQEAKDVLQIGSVIEREFEWELIRRGLGIPEDELLSLLSVLKDVDLLYERGLHPESTYVFRHALIRDVIYESILTHNRKKLHEKIGNVIESLYKENMVEYYGILAEHYIASENYMKGAEFSKLEATRSERAGAINDAIDYTRKRVASLERLPRTDDVQEQIIDARTALGKYLLNILKYKEAKLAIDPIIDLAVQGDYKKRLPEILTINGTYEMNIKEDAAKAFVYLEKAVNISRELKDYASLSFSSYRLGLTRALNCEFEKAIQQFKSALNIMTAINNSWGICASNSYLCLWGYVHCGRLDQADQSSDAAIQIAEESGDIHAKAMAYTSRGSYLYFKGLLDESTEHFLKAINFCEKVDYDIINAIARAWLGELCYEIGEYQNSKDHHTRAVWLLKKHGVYSSWIDHEKHGVAKAQVMMNENDVDLNSVFGYVSNNKVKFFEGWKQRYMGEILFNIDKFHLSDAENWIKKAIATRRRDGMILYLARDYVLLADLFKHKCEKHEAKENLGKAIDIFKKCGADGWVKKCEKELAEL
jgi:class 3 adenylate cyclase/tetratricopeptide (TPR) repeat protein